MVQADTLSASSIIESLERGAYYASSGVTLSTLSTEDNEIEIEIAAEENISYEIIFMGCRKGKNEVEELRRIQGTKAQMRITDDYAFIRAKIVSDKRHQNPIEDIIYEMAWTQPVPFIDGIKH